MKKTFKFKIQNPNIIPLLGCLFAFACAATDIVPNPSAPGNLGSATNGFPNAYASNFFGRFIGDGSGLTNLNAGGGTNGGAPLAAGPGITITPTGGTNVVSVTSGMFATPAQVAQATNGLGGAIPFTTQFGGVIYTISATANQTTPSGVNMACMTRKPYQSGYFPLKNIAVSVPGYYQQGNGDISFSNSYTVYASVEYPVGNMTPFTWGGNSNLLVTPGKTNYFSDALPGLVIPANTNFYIREYATTTNGSLVEASVVSVNNSFNGLGTIGLGGGAIIATDAPNLYLSGTIPDGETFCVAPFSIVAQRADNAITPPISIALRGDSISSADSPQLAGFNYTVNAASVLASAYGIPLMNLATSGNFFYVENTNPINNQLALNSSVVLNCLGVNDCLVQNFDSFSTLTNLAVTGWLNDYKLGKKVYGWTLTPDSSTFPYTNSASLRDTNQEAIRQQYNNWIRTVPWPLSGYIEAAHAVDPNDNGYWNANNNYGDGVHPNAMGEAQIFTNMIPVFQQIAMGAISVPGAANTFTAGNSLIINSNAWNLVTATNGAANFSTVMTTSNGVLTFIYCSNGVAFHYFIEQGGSGGIIP